MKSLKRVSKTLIFTLLLLLAFMFSSYGRSGAKYYKDEKDSVTYNLGFEALTKVGNGVFSLDYTKSKHDLAYFEYSVPRNNIMTQEDSSDTYRVIVNEGCEIKEINNTVISNGTNTATYVYNNNLAGSISVKYSCPVEKILLNNSTELFNTTVTIREQMSTDYKEFKYLSQVSDTLKVSTSLPPEEAANPDVLTILENDTEVEVLTKINQWLTYKVDEYKKNNSASTGFSADLNPTDLLSYFKKGYPDGDIRNFDTTLVQNIKVTKANGTYVFELDDDFMAYALTDTKVNSSSTFKVFYFADMTKTDAELEALFEYYVDKYVFNKNSQNYTDLMNYINANGGIVAMMRGTVTNTNIRFDNGRLRIRSSFLSNIPTTTNTINKAPSKNPVDNSTPNTSVTNPEDTNPIVEQLLIDYPELKDKEKLLKFVKIDSDLKVSSRTDVKINDYLIYNLDNENILINVYTDEEGNIKATLTAFTDALEIDFSLATKISIALNYVENDSENIVNKFNEIINLIDSKYVNLITNDMIDNYLENKGLFIDSENGVIKAYLINNNDELNRGTLIDGNNIDSNITNGTPDVSITDDPEKVVSGDTPDDEIPIFDGLVTTEPSDIVTDTVTGENETETETPEKQEEEERENEESSEEDDNSKKADTDIEKEFVSDIEEVEKLIEDMKEFVGDAENVSVEEEAIAEVDELIETVKDYVNEV